MIEFIKKVVVNVCQIRWCTGHRRRFAWTMRSTQVSDMHVKLKDRQQRHTTEQTIIYHFKSNQHSNDLKEEKEKDKLCM